jgi:hypothetical protein
MKDWRGLGAPQMKALENLILDVQKMPYLTEGERKMNLWRHPTQAEFRGSYTEAQGFRRRGLAVYNRMRQMDETFLQLLEQEAKEAARRRLGNDPVKLAARIDEIEMTGRLRGHNPFFPFTRFGRYYVTVKDASG